MQNFYHALNSHAGNLPACYLLLNRVLPISIESILHLRNFFSMILFYVMSIIRTLAFQCCLTQAPVMPNFLYILSGIIGTYQKHYLVHCSLTTSFFFLTSLSTFVFKLHFTRRILSLCYFTKFKLPANKK